MHNKAIHRTLDKDWCWGEEAPEGRILPGWWGIILLFKDTKWQDFFTCSAFSPVYTKPATCMVHNLELLRWAFLIHTQLHLTLCDPMDCSPPGSSVHGIFQATLLEWAAISSSRGSSRPRDGTHISHVSCITGGFLTAEPLGKPFLGPWLSKKENSRETEKREYEP